MLLDGRFPRLGLLYSRGHVAERAGQVEGPLALENEQRAHGNEHRENADERRRVVQHMLSSLCDGEHLIWLGCWCCLRCWIWIRICVRPLAFRGGRPTPDLMKLLQAMSPLSLSLSLSNSPDRRPNKMGEKPRFQKKNPYVDRRESKSRWIGRSERTPALTSTRQRD